MSPGGRPLVPMLRWLQDTLPRAVGLRVIPDILPVRTGDNEIKLPIRGYSQIDSYSCGVAAAWSVLRYLRPDADFREFDAACAPNPESGTSTAQLSAALRRYQLCVVRLREVDFATIRMFLKSGLPVLTTIRELHWEEDMHHWVAIFGYGWKPRRIHYIGRTRAPGFSKRELDWREFKSIWTGQDDSLVCIPQEMVPRKMRNASRGK